MADVPGGHLLFFGAGGICKRNPSGSVRNDKNDWLYRHPHRLAAASAIQKASPLSGCRPDVRRSCAADPDLAEAGKQSGGFSGKFSGTEKRRGLYHLESKYNWASLHAPGFRRRAWLDGFPPVADE